MRRKPETKTSPHEVRMTSARFPRSSAAFVVCAGITAVAFTLPAQSGQKAAFANGYPVAPMGLADQPLREGPFIYHTAEQQDVRVSVFARGLEYPYSMAFLP